MSAALLKKMREMGLTFDQAIELLDKIEDTESLIAGAGLSSGAMRTRKWREKKEAASRCDVTVTSPETRHGDVSHVGERTQVVTPSLPSLRSEELKTSEAYASSVGASKPASPTKPEIKPPKSRGTRLPDDWEPSETEMALARAEGLTDEEIQRAALEFRNYWCARSRDAVKLSWPRTWHNRVIEIGDRKRRDGARLAAQAARPGGGRRGPSSFADIYARRHGHTAD